jgi:hypothetical protein
MIGHQYRTPMTGHPQGVSLHFTKLGCIPGDHEPDASQMDARELDTHDRTPARGVPTLHVGTRQC